MSTSDGSTAANILTAALGHMRDRAATYDKPEGERSMGATVDAFLAVTGVSMTEEQGWLFMALLKAVRSQQGAYRADSYEDGAAYFALAGEAAVRDRKQESAHNNQWADRLREKMQAGEGIAFAADGCVPAHIDPADVEPASAIDDDSERMQAIGQNGEMASEVYAAVDGAPSWNCAPEWANWLAQDLSGMWFWFDKKPFATSGDGWFVGCADYEFAIDGTANSLWRETLRERPAK